MYFKQIYVKIAKTSFESGCHCNSLTGTVHTQLSKFYEKSPNFVAVAAFVAKIRIFEISAGTSCIQDTDCSLSNVHRPWDTDTNVGRFAALNVDILRRLRS